MKTSIKYFILSSLIWKIQYWLFFKQDSKSHYLEVPFLFKDEGGIGKVVFLVPKTYIKSKDCAGAAINPKNFYGVDLTQVLAQVEKQ